MYPKTFFDEPNFLYTFQSYNQARKNIFCKTGTKVVLRAPVERL